MNSRGIGGAHAEISDNDVLEFLSSLLVDFAREAGQPRRVLLVPPDQTRAHSRASLIAADLAKLLGSSLAALLPATGTHRPMGEREMVAMYPEMAKNLFLSHDHRSGTRQVGKIEADFIGSISKGRFSFAFPGEFNTDLLDGGWDCVISIGQVVPHEVVGMSNYTKNLVVGLGGARAIDLSHWLGAVEGLENVMGKPESAARRLIDESARRFLRSVPTLYIMSVVGPDPSGAPVLRGLFAGPGPAPKTGEGSDGLAFRMAASLSAEVNITTLPKPLATCVINLDSREFRSTWLGNKAIYRSRMALADGAELFILAPGLERFGEDPRIDALIRRHGYRGTDLTMDAVRSDPELAANLAAAAHLIHGSSEGRFRITYCTDPSLKDAIESVGYSWMSLGEAESRFIRPRPIDGMNRSREGEEYFYISNPALGLWKCAET